MPGADAGDAFINCGIKKLFFTGSVAAGKKLMSAAGEKLLPVSLELGGNDAMIVCSDADLERAANTALWAGFSNAGQSCGGVERIYAEADIYDDFVRLLKTKADRLRIGNDNSFSTDIGSITTKKQFERVDFIVNDAVSKGAKASLHGALSAGSDKGLFIKPVIIEDAPDNAAGLMEEIFGPVVFVSRVKDTDEAIIKANNSELGLTASVWTRSNKKAALIADRLEAGAITVNDHLMSHGLAETPWGGFKNSGIGRTHGELGLDEMTQPQVVVFDLFSFMRKNIWNYPYSSDVFYAIKGALDALYSKKTAKRFSGLCKVIRLFISSV